MTWAGASETYFNQWEAYWKTKLGGQTNFDLALQDGVIEPEQETMGGASFSGNLAAAMQQISATKSGKTEVVVYDKIAMGKFNPKDSMDKASSALASQTDLDED